MNDAAQAVMAFSFFGAIAVTAWSIARVWIKRLDTRPEPKSFDLLDQKLTRINAAVEAIAIEVERISEAQRFTARLMAGRDDGKLSPPRRVSDARTVTPH